MTSRLPSQIIVTPTRQPKQSDHTELERNLRLPVHEQDEAETLQEGNGASHQDARRPPAVEKARVESASNKPAVLQGIPAARDATPELPQRTICICADDFGLHTGINQAAVILAREHRISAISSLWMARRGNPGGKPLKQLPLRLKWACISISLMILVRIQLCTHSPN